MSKAVGIQLLRRVESGILLSSQDGVMETILLYLPMKPLLENV